MSPMFAKMGYIQFFQFDSWDSKWPVIFWWAAAQVSISSN